MIRSLVRRRERLTDIALLKLRRAAQRIASPFDRADRQSGALLIGYFDGLLGLGQSSRNTALALEMTDADFVLYPFAQGLEGRLDYAFMPHRRDTSSPRQVNIIEVACDQLPHVFSNVEQRFFQRSCNVLRTYWELPKVPPAWRRYLRPIHEIWAPSRFVFESFQAEFPKQTLLIPPAIDVSAQAILTHEDFGLDSSVFWFVFTFDYHSYIERKNPIALARCFVKAFSNDDKVGLVFKTVGEPRASAQARDAVTEAVAYDARIRVLDQTLSRPELLAFLSLCGCYVSLHRAEGFGFALAEAMALGIPVIGTDYSGSRDFLSEHTGYPVAYKPIEVQRHQYPWAHGQTWADPNEDSAIAQMRAVYFDRQESQRRAAAGQTFISQHFSPAVVGPIVKARIDFLEQAGC